MLMIIRGVCWVASDPKITIVIAINQTDRNRRLAWAEPYASGHRHLHTSCRRTSRRFNAFWVSRIWEISKSCLIES
jgi:hypothetical protein